MKRLVALIVVLLLAGMFGAAWAQEVTGSIAGTVTDSSGAAVAGAKVSIRSLDKSVVVRELTTESNGQYLAVYLPIGRYELIAEASNFKKSVYSNIVLNVADKLTINLALEVGSVNESVLVEANPLQVELQSATAGGLINGTQVRELSLNGRNWEQLVTLTPGVSDSGNSDTLYVGAFAPQGTNLVTFSMNGGRREQNNFMIDGADNVDRGSNLTLLSFPSVDSIAEFRVIRGQYDPEYGRAASGQVNVITRSGTSMLHGSAYEFWRNDMLNARSFASLYPTILAHKPYLRYHDFGGTIGGPVWIPKVYEHKDKTFFFFSEEVRRNLTYSNGAAEVPTTGMLQGQFAHPVCVSFDANNACTATGTSIAPTSFDPIAQAYIKDVFSKYPTPNAATATDPFAFTSTLRNIFNFREEIIKIDHIVNKKLSFSGKILRDTIPTQEAIGLFSSGPPIQGVGTTSTNSPGHNYTVRATIALSPTFLIEPGYSYSYGAIVSHPIGLVTQQNSPDVAAAVKLPFTPTLTRIPAVTLSGGSGPASFGPYQDYNRNHTAFGNVTKTLGSHSIKFGAIYYHYNKNENAGGNNVGTFAFNVNGIPGGVGTFNLEQAWANFLQGRVGTFSQSSLDLTANIMDNQFEFYSQDNWRMKSNLTITYGFRYSFFRQPTDANGMLGQFDPAVYDRAKAPCILSNGNLDTSLNASGQIVSACNANFSPLNGYIFAHPPAGGTQSPFGSKVGKEYNRGIAPRLGLAWDPWKDGKTSIRAGFGMFYDNGQEFGNAENDIFLGSGFNTNLSVTNTTTQNPTGGTRSFSPAAPQLQSRVPIDYKYPYTTQWSLDVQRDVFHGWIVDVGYYGNNGIHLPGFLDINQPAPNTYLNCTFATPCMSGANSITFNTTVNGQPVVAVTAANTNKLNVLRPFIGWNGGNAFEEIYTSNYHSLQTQVQKQFKGNTLVNLSYTWSHCLTSYQADRSTGRIMPVQGDFRSNYGPCIADRRHVVTANFVWDIPYFREQRGFAGHVLGGWELSGIQTFQTGLPETVAANQAIDPTGADCLGPSPCVLRANQVGNPNANEPNSFENWFNATAFASPLAGQTTAPSEGPGAVRLPGFWRTDLGMFKNLKFTERFGGQFRFETFNTFNHLNPICCASFTIGNANFDKIRSARDPRILQLALKFNF